MILFLSNRKAKQVIEQTIQPKSFRSPVPLSECYAMVPATEIVEGSKTASNLSAVASASVSALATDQTGVKIFHSASSSGLKLNLALMDTVNIDDYQHTITVARTVGKHDIKIVGNNLQLVKVRSPFHYLSL